MIDKPPRIALLIDADNSPAAKIDLILNELSTFGETSIRRAYGNWKKQELRGWEEQLHEHAIRPMQQFDYSKGKNASDMAMVIDALDLLYTDRPEAFGIVSSDADFTPLVMHLRAKGAAVYGFGAQKTPEPFVNACSRFLFLDKLGGTRSRQRRRTPTRAQQRATTSPAPLRVPTAKLKQDAKLVGCCATRSRRRRARTAGRASARSASRSATRRRSTRATTATRTLTKLLEATELFQLDKEGTSEVSVRDIRAGARARSPDRRARAERKRRLRGVAFAVDAAAKSARTGLTSAFRASCAASPAGVVLPRLDGGLGLGLARGTCRSVRCSCTALSCSFWAPASPAGASGCRLPCRPGSAPCARRWSCPRTWSASPSRWPRRPGSWAWPWRSALTSARLGDGAEACAKAPCENTATAAATAPRTSLVFIG